MQGSRGLRGRKTTVSSIQLAAQPEYNPVSVEEPHDQLQPPQESSKPIERKEKRPSIIPTNVSDEMVDTSDWTHGAKRNSEVNVVKAKYPGFFPRIKQREFPPYVFNQSIEASQVNKHMFELIQNKHMNLVYPSIKEEKRARRLLPVPVSLTGFGLDDGRSARYWSNRMRKAIDKIQSGIQEIESQDLLENVTPSVRNVLESHDVTGDAAELKEWYLEAKKQNQIEQENKGQNIPEDIQFPYKIAMELRNQLEEELQDMKQEIGVESRPELLDKEYNEYMNHRKVLDIISKGMEQGVKKGNILPEEYDSELEAWKQVFWRRSYGSANPTISPSKVPCGGCGANMHCTDPSIPGYLPSEKFVSMKDSDLRKEKCQRCEFMDHFNVSVDVTVDPDDYPAILSKIQENKAMVILMVDLLDFPCSIWPDVIPLIGKNRKIFVVGNKIDLLPRDGINYFERVEQTLKKSLSAAGVDASKDIHIRNITLISAKTGYGVENLITKIYEAWNREEDIYLIGCTNVGKSTLFNALLQSDLCHVRENDLIQRATTSLWPGTTLNLLKFPINRIEGWAMEMRKNRLRILTRVKAEEHQLRDSLWKQEDNPEREEILNRVGMTFREQVPFTKESSHPFATKSSLQKPFNENNYFYTGCKFFYDSPGTIYKDQLLSLLTTEELLKTIPRTTITPRTFSLQPFQSLFIAGLARLDVVSSRQNVLLTVFASDYLPIHVVYTNEAKRFYNIFLGTELLAVPFGSTERLNHWPSLVPKTIEDFKGVDWRTSCGDIVLSSAGWISVTIGAYEECVLKAFTPEGRGIHVRPSVLPYAVNMKGKRVIGTPCYESKRVTVEDYFEYERPKMEKRTHEGWSKYQNRRREDADVIRSYRIKSSSSSE